MFDWDRDRDLSLENLYELIRVTSKITHKKLDAIFRVVALVQREDTNLMDQVQALADAIKTLGDTMGTFIADSATASQDILDELAQIAKQPGAPDLSGVMASVSALNDSASQADGNLQAALAKVPSPVPAPAPAPGDPAPVPAPPDPTLAPDGTPLAPQATTPPQPAPAPVPPGDVPPPPIQPI